MIKLIDKPNIPGCWWMWTSKMPPLKTIFYVEEGNGKLWATDGVLLWDFDDPEFDDCIGWEHIA